jgi:hypothetical protein
MTHDARIVGQFVEVERANRPGEALPGREGTDAYRLINRCDADGLDHDFDLLFA